MAFGPTQNYDDATLGAWRPRPLLARFVRILIAVLPLVLVVAFGWAAVRWFPPHSLGMNPWLWLAGEVAISMTLLVVVGRQVRRLLPLTTLLRLTLYFPDRAPSRFAVARRTHSPTALRERIERAQENGAEPSALDRHAELLLGLVAALNAHDRTTFSHSERVQAYAALIAAELGLPPAEVARLSWAALLHDVGKLHVPHEILNKAGKPTDEEWRVLSSHPAHGAAIAAPLAEWLGPWLGAIEQHHERWDGAGYPHGFAREEISHAARIVAVADAFDVITTARSYKKPLSATAARAELARCAGRQFDPEVVRAFLAVGLGRVRAVAGPLSLLSALPGLRSMPVPDVGSTLSSIVAAAPAAGAAAAATVVAAAFTIADPLAVTGDGATPAPPAADSLVSQIEPDGGGRGGLLADDGDAKNGDASAGTGVSPTQIPSLTDHPSSATDETTDGDRDASGPSEKPDHSGLSGPHGPGGAGSSANPGSGPSGTAGPPGTLPSTSQGTPPGVPAAGAPGHAGPPASPPAGKPTAPPTSTPRPSVTPPTAGPPSPEASGDACADARAGLTALRGAHLAGCDLSGVTLTNVDLSGAKLNGADLSDAVISGTSFDGARLNGADFAGATITGSSFRGAKTNSQTFRGAQLIDCVFA